MKNINPSHDPAYRTLNPVLTSKSDGVEKPGHVRLRTLAKTIPEKGTLSTQLTIQGCISATIHATQEYLCHIVNILGTENPQLASGLVVSSSGLDAICWLDRTMDSQHGWIPPCPVSGHITLGRHEVFPLFGRSPIEPAITLNVFRNDEVDDATFMVVFSVTDSEDMRVLALLLNEEPDLWLRFESKFDVKPFTPIPLPEEDELSNIDSCRDYINSFVKNVLSDADEERCVETLELHFTIRDSDVLQEVVIGAVALLQAFTLYQHSIETMDCDNTRTEALKAITYAIDSDLF